MPKAKKSESVPKKMQAKFDSITALTDDFAAKYLNDEYAQLIRYATAALCRKRPSPLASGRDYTWACGITHAIGMVNFLFDPAQDPHISAGELYEIFGVGASTGQGKSKKVRDTLKMSQMDPNWGLPSKMDSNPLIWMLEVNGFIMDIRSAPREVQEIAFAKGLIPYIPGEQNESVEDPAEASTEEEIEERTEGTTNTLYVLEVGLLGGPITEDFIEKNPVVYRTIEIKGRNTLADLHNIIFAAFDREEEHLYEFQLGGSRPNDPKAKRYGLKMPDMPDPLNDSSEATLASLKLRTEDVFGYWFDFGDDWWHQINVTKVAPKAPKGKYPKITERVGDSPPQYADF
ncbi:MAG: plasmid pRiA4b ORF-3 family protein [Cyanobacteria bacterium J06621_11]